MSKSQELKNYVRLAILRGFSVPKGSSNGGGWVKLAAVCGYQTDNKSVARRWLFTFFKGVQSKRSVPQSNLVPSDTKVIDPNGSEFLHSYVWRKLRLQALKRYGRRCGCCGAVPNEDNAVRIHVDHVKPRKHFPELALDINNLQVLCEDCNHGKGNWDRTDWRNPEQLDNAPRIRLHVVK